MLRLCVRAIVSACACVFACLYTCVFACVRVCVRACVCVYVYVCSYVRDFDRVHYLKFDTLADYEPHRSILYLRTPNTSILCILFIKL